MGSMPYQDQIIQVWREVPLSRSTEKNNTQKHVRHVYHGLLYRWKRYYIDGSDTEQWDFLGYTLKEAHARLEYIKNFLSLEPLGLVAL